MDQLELCIVIPVYNEEGCIEQVAKDWTQCFQKHSVDYKVLFINDGSTDATEEVLNEIKQKDHRNLVIHQQNQGHGPTVMRGYKEALKLKAKWVLQIDSDDQLSPEDFIKFWDKRHEAAFVLGIREKRHDPFHRLVITKILLTLIFLIGQCKVRDANVPYRLIHSSLLEKMLMVLPLNLFAPNIFLSILAKKSKYQFREVVIQHKERQTGSISIVRFKLLKVCFQTALDLIIFRLNLKKSMRIINA